jgi:hypothetical protein
MVMALTDRREGADNPMSRESLTQLTTALDA